ncbi:hypothetical protein F2P81_008589 [Scophthalmus maximus]|uniref:Uncharacterized protein n=1 Tax=Scophthalmus maximus TaxID=52904 RepID=A0A6A4SZ99_SCOMX|nr:hypothetical protein F2P81_008589 [Scophthalmus maximus]
MTRVQYKCSCPPGNSSQKEPSSSESSTKHRVTIIASVYFICGRLAANRFENSTCGDSLATGKKKRKRIDCN